MLQLILNNYYERAEWIYLYRLILTQSCDGRHDLW